MCAWIDTRRELQSRLILGFENKNRSADHQRNRILRIMLSSTPQGYKVAYQTKTTTGSMLEMIPEGESLDQWTEMLTVQVMRNVNGYTLAGFYAGMKDGWAGLCPHGATEIVERGREQLQPTLYWSHACPLNKNTGQPEYTWFKVLIRGGNVIVAQKAFKFEPPAEIITFWLSFLRELRVDHRLTP